MTERISKYQRFKMMNPVIQFIVAGGHGGTRKVN